MNVDYVKCAPWSQAKGMETNHGDKRTFHTFSIPTSIFGAHL